MATDLRKTLQIANDRLQLLNEYLVAPTNPLVGRLVELVEKHGGVESINKRAAEHRQLPNLLKKLEEEKSPYLKDVRWLIEQRDKGAFVSIADYRKRVLGDAAATTKFNEKNAVTLEISAVQFFPWLIAQAKQALEKRELMAGRFIRVRNMKEQVAEGELVPLIAAIQVMGASWVETLDTKGTDGSNVHLGGPGTITGYFGGVGQPDEHAIQWADEYLHYATEYGVQQVLNVNAGTILVGYLLHRMGVDIEFKISVYMGNDNPYAVLWTLLGARLFARDDGSTPLVGFNFANSVHNDTIRLASQVRAALGFEKQVRFEHHIVETYKSIVVQPYDRLAELVEVAAEVPNISAKHEGAAPEIEKTREHPSDILEYFLAKADILKQGLMPALERNYLDKHDSVNRTADALTKAGIAVIAAPNLHK
ncbi:MAG: hypothetical protein JXB32_15530 [Deltaproteobacteria bacterium]|nr:hypothetical protein [Deltaproteobacteria bacterium]